MRLDKLTLMNFVVGLIRPVVRFCLSHGLKLQDFIECTKAAFVFEGRSQLERQGSINMSRLSAFTGLQRREIGRFSRDGLAGLKEQRDVFSKVMGLWQVHPDFATKAGKPRLLSFGFENSEFNELVARVSKDLGAASVLAELERVQAVERSPDGKKVRLAMQSYVPKEDASQGMQILSEDIRDMISAVEENLFNPQPLRNLHARTHFDKVRAQDIPTVQAFLLREGHQFHERVRRYLASLDQDINPDPDYSGPTLQIALGSYSHIKSENKV